MLETIKKAYEAWLLRKQENHVHLITVDLLHKQCIDFLVQNGVVEEDGHTLAVSIREGAVTLSVQPMDREGLLEYDQPDDALWYQHFHIKYRESGEAEEEASYSSLVDPFNDTIHYFHVSGQGQDVSFVHAEGIVQPSEVLLLYQRFLAEKILPVIQTH